MRPPTPYLAFLNLSPPQSPQLPVLQSPIDTLAAYLLSPSGADTALLDDSELTPTMQYATLPSSYSPLLQHHREQQLHALQQQQCIPGLSQIYTPMSTAYPTGPSDLTHLQSSSPDSSAAYDEPDADSDYTPSSSFSRKRSTPGANASPSSSFNSTGALPSQKGPSSVYDDDAAAAPAPKRQRAAPSGPISTKDWVPPDVTGLNKREARLVKNRAAAFLSRQRKREEFELMEMCVIVSSILFQFFELRRL